MELGGFSMSAFDPVEKKKRRDVERGASSNAPT